MVSIERTAAIVSKCGATVSAPVTLHWLLWTSMLGLAWNQQLFRVFWKTQLESRIHVHVLMAATRSLTEPQGKLNEGEDQSKHAKECSWCVDCPCFLMEWFGIGTWGMGYILWFPLMNILRCSEWRKGSLNQFPVDGAFGCNNAFLEF